MKTALKIFVLTGFLALAPLARSQDLPCDDQFAAFMQSIQKNSFGPFSGKPIAHESWPIDGPKESKENYESAFSSLIPNLYGTSHKDFFENYLETSRKSGFSSNVLDLFGSGFFIKNQARADSITGVRFESYDRSLLPKEYTNTVPEEVLGDIFDLKTWEKLDKSMKERNIAQMDLVVMKLEAGWYFNQDPNTALKENLYRLEYVLRNVSHRLSSNGIFLFSIRLPSIYGDVSKSPQAIELVKRLAESSSHKLVLDSLVVNHSTVRLNGAYTPITPGP